MTLTIGMPETNRRLTVDEAAEYTGLAVSSMASMRCRGGGPTFIKMGARIVYLQSDLDEYMNRRRGSCLAQMGAADEGDE